jgi:hypothetical protein
MPFRACSTTILRFLPWPLRAWFIPSAQILLLRNPDMASAVKGVRAFTSYASETEKIKYFKLLHAAGMVRFSPRPPRLTMAVRYRNLRARGSRSAPPVRGLDRRCRLCRLRHLDRLRRPLRTSWPWLMARGRNSSARSLEKP